MKNIYIYPITDSTKSASRNPYISNMVQSLGTDSVVNLLPSKFGIMSGWRYIFKAHIFIFNWTENIPKRKAGIIQVLFFICLLFLIRILKRKVVWILHNKEPHTGHSCLSIFCMYCSAKLSTRIVTHSTDGLIFIKNKYGTKTAQKVVYFPHPAYSSKVMELDRTHICYDYIIWGTIEQYKGLLDFFHFVKHSHTMHKRKILVVGYCPDELYLKELLKQKSDNISLIEGFISEEKLISYISQSKAILFVYNPKSVLSSGALIKSLNFGKHIVGPNSGAFSDLEKHGIVRTFSSFKDIENVFVDDDAPINSIKGFISTYSWSAFARIVKN